MRVALDGTPLSVSSGGIRRYTFELSRALALTFPEDDFFLLSDQPTPELAGRPANLHRSGAPRNFLERRWWLAGLSREMARRKIELFHGVDFATPYLPLRPTVLTLHDLSPWKDFGGSPASERVRRRTPGLVGLGLATMVVTPSEAARREAIGRFRIHPRRVVAVPLAASSAFHPVRGPAPERPYFLYVGGLEARKNVGLIVAAWREIARQHAVDLVLVGKRRPDFPAPPQVEGLRWLGEAPDEDLPRLYSGAVAFVYPSLYEGFGLPPLEAMCCGTAVLVSRDEAVAEVVGDAGLRLEAHDVRAWAEAMRGMLSNAEARGDLGTRGLRRAAAFSWERTARRTRQVYEQARERFHG